MEGISSFLSPPLLKILIIKFRIYGIGGEGKVYGRHDVYWAKFFAESQSAVLQNIFAG